MHFFKKFYFKTFRYDLINKFTYNSTKNLPQLNKIILNFGSKKNDIKKLATSLLAFELICHQKGMLTVTIKSNILLKIHKGEFNGCKLTLQNKNLFDFVQKIIIEIFPGLKNLNKVKSIQKLKKRIFSYEIYEIFKFPELRNHYYYFFDLPKLDITIVTTASNKKELVFILNSFQFPFKH